MKIHLLSSAILICAIQFCAAQKNPSPTGAKNIAPQETYSKQLYSGMKWRSIGPYQGGRSLTSTGVIGDPLTYYLGATGGGVWKTVDGAITWFPVSDSTFHSASVGALAVAPGDPNVIYVGMGEAAIRNTAIMGDGIYKSIDAGKTWKHVLTLEASATGRLIIHPKNADIAFAAVAGKMFGENKERGIYRTTDGGKTWKQVLYKDEKTGAIDIDFDPTNPNIIYASLWQVNRKPWLLTSGGTGSGLYKSVDGGDTWNLLSENPGMPKGILGKICIAVSATNPQRVYAMIENKEHPGLYRSDNGGKTWGLISSKNDLSQRPWYFSEIFCDPNNENVLYVSNVEFWKSIDGGVSFSKIGQEHGDNHDMWINPDNSDNFIIADDGSAAVTYNGGRTWTDEDLPTCQFYHVNLDNDFPYHAYGGQQDWGPIRIATRTYGSGIGKKDWYYPAGGEAGYIVPDPTDPTISFGGEYDGIMSRHDKKNEQYQSISVYPLINDGWGANFLKNRFAWTYPISFSPWDNKEMYCTSQYVHQTKNGGMSWETISPDLTRNDPSKQLQSGGPITPDNTGAEIYCTVYAFAESPAKQGELWAGSDDGLIHLSTDDGKTWSDVTPKDLQPWSTVSIIEPSHFDAGTCFFAAHRYRLDDTHPYIYRTTDYGKTWTMITNGLPANVYSRCVREDPNRKNLLYAGTETGAYISFDNGDHWQSMQLNLPVTPVHDMQVKKDLKDLVIATHGRGFWVLDDLTPFYQISDSVSHADYWLYQPNVAIRMDGNQSDPENEATIKQQTGTNAPNGVIVDYYLKQKPSGEIKLVFYTSAGDSIMAFSNKIDKYGEPIKTKGNFYADQKPKEDMLPTNVGMNRFVWNLVYPDAKHFEEEYWAAGSLAGPKALPGNYIVKLMKGDTSLMQRNFTIILNPKVKTSQEDLKMQFDLMMEVHKKQNEIIRSILQIRGVESQVNNFVNGFSDSTKIISLKKIAKPLLDSLHIIGDTLINSKIKANEDDLRYPMQLFERYCSLQDFIRGADARPTEQERTVFEELNARLAPELIRLTNVFYLQIPAFNNAVKQLELDVVDPGRVLKK
ncbi:MAG: glycosyl hydrolase [Saprospiraceae bacterium]|uniref:Glycosyl hydrolase n=1 Tax=Candidatus Opimibacter skivensis TaxID=2982028 RepID=A0A9D7XNG9_9BACT|nr:glycosyl hydrolase [Candidatus Opimibacter skivensis]